MERPNHPRCPAQWQREGCFAPYLLSQLIDPAILRRDDFEAFMADRRKRLLGLIEQANGKAVFTGEEQKEVVDVDTVEAIHRPNMSA